MCTVLCVLHSCTYEEYFSFYFRGESIYEKSGRCLKYTFPIMKEMVEKDNEKSIVYLWMISIIIYNMS